MWVAKDRFKQICILRFFLVARATLSPALKSEKIPDLGQCWPSEWVGCWVRSVIFRRMIRIRDISNGKVFTFGRVENELLAFGPFGTSDWPLSAQVLQ